MFLLRNLGIKSSDNIHQLHLQGGLKILAKEDEAIACCKHIGIPFLAIINYNIDDLENNNNNLITLHSFTDKYNSKCINTLKLEDTAEYVFNKLQEQYLEEVNSTDSNVSIRRKKLNLDDIAIGMSLCI